MTVIPFPVAPVADIAGEARAFADEVDAGDLGRIDAALVITSGAVLGTHYWGEGLDLVEAIGILETAKYHLVQRLCGE